MHVHCTHDYWYIKFTNLRTHIYIYIYIDVLYLYSKWHIYFYMFWFYVYVIERSQTPEIKPFHCHWWRVVFSPGPMHCECSVAGISSLAHCKLRCEEHEMCRSVLFLGRQVQGCNGGNLLKHGSADWKQWKKIIGSKNWDWCVKEMKGKQTDILKIYFY